MTEEVSDDEIKKLEEELKTLEDKDEGYGSPTASQKDTLFKFFLRILTMKDTTRIGNLSVQELGQMKLSERGYKRIAKFASSEGLDAVSDYINGMAGIMTETSMSKKGFWPQLFVSQIKIERKSQAKDAEKKRKWFGGGKKEGGEETE